MIMTNCLLNVAMPANVFLVMTNLSSVSSGDIFPTDIIMPEIFTFSPTDITDAGFVAMGVDSARLTLYLGSVFIYMVILVVQVIVYGFAYALRNHSTVLNRIQNKIKDTFFWRGIIRMGLESYLDMCIGIYCSFKMLSFETGSDIFDIVLTCLCTLIVVGLPIAIILVLRKHSKLDDPSFQEKFGSLTEGYKTEGDFGTDAAKKMICWFMMRRFLTAIIIVPLAAQGSWIQLAPNVFLSLADACITYHLNPYESAMSGYMAKFNNTIVLFLSYFPFLFTNMVPDPEARYQAGWMFISITALMVVINLIVVVQHTVVETIEEARRKAVEHHNHRMLQIRRIEMNIIVMSPLQKLRTYIGIDWLFA
jgi:hypothetical protein